jgi:hypothetical protein
VVAVSLVVNLVDLVIFRQKEHDLPPPKLILVSS